MPCGKPLRPILVILSTILVSGCSSHMERDGTTHSLFNGKDLTGWVVKCRADDTSRRF
jgi:uncharacterized protein YceK